jgi:4-amino-4-deoxy-L-arabinose transferase-like glycosyltransferase
VESDGTHHRGSTGWATWAFLGVCLLVGIVCILLILMFGYGRDQGIFAVIGRTILEGGMPYRDAWDLKPPGIYLIFAFTRLLFGSGPWGIRLVEVVGLLVTSFLLVRLSVRWWKDYRIGVLAATLLLLIQAQLDFWHTAQAETFGGMLIVAALATGTTKNMAGRLGGIESRRTWLFVSGILFGAAGVLKPTLAGGVLALAAAAAISDRREGGSRRAANAVAVLIAGCIVPTGACVVWFGATGTLGDAYRVLAEFTPQYAAMTLGQSSFPALLYHGLLEWTGGYSALVFCGLVAMLWTGFEPGEKNTLGLALTILGLGLVGVALQAKFFPYHLSGLWPLTVLIAARGIERLWRRAWQRAWWGGALTAGLLCACLFARTATRELGSFWDRAGDRLALFASGNADIGTLDRLASVADVNAAANRVVAQILRRVAASDRSVFIWGFEPVIYDLSDRKPSSRYIFNIPQRSPWGAAEARTVLMRELAANVPAAVVVEHRDVFPMFTGSMRDSAMELETFPELARLLAERYRPYVRIEDFDIYVESTATLPDLE